MDKLVRKIEIPLARKIIEKAGLYVVQKKDLDRLAEVAADAYQDSSVRIQHEAHQFQACHDSELSDMQLHDVLHDG